MQDLAPLSPILQHTPNWVWGVALGLVALGSTQMLPREVGARRALGLPILLAGWSMVGAATSFGALALAAWLMAAAATVAGGWARADLARARYDAVRARFWLPGSPWPLALMLGVFVLKFAAGASLALQPGLAQQWPVALAAGALGGAISGLFLGRALALWQRLQQAPAALAA